MGIMDDEATNRRQNEEAHRRIVWDMKHTPDEVLARNLSELADSYYGDPEKIRDEADMLITQELWGLGYKEAMKAYTHLEKWYS